MVLSVTVSLYNVLPADQEKQSEDIDCYNNHFPYIKKGNLYLLITPASAGAQERKVFFF